MSSRLLVVQIGTQQSTDRLVHFSGNVAHCS
jgi:hypothetical protein